MWPLSHMMKPEMERDLKISMGGSDGFGLDWSWGPQFASVKGVIVLLERGNLKKELRVEFLRLWKEMPRCFVPLRYLRTRLAASRWPLVAR